MDVQLLQLVVVQVHAQRSLKKTETFGKTQQKTLKKKSYLFVFRVSGQNELEHNPDQTKITLTNNMQT
jgi:hypothetical protein